MEVIVKNRLEKDRRSIVVSTSPEDDILLKPSETSSSIPVLPISISLTPGVGNYGCYIAFPAELALEFLPTNRTNISIFTWIDDNNERLTVVKIPNDPTAPPWELKFKETYTGISADPPKVNVTIDDEPPSLGEG